MDYGTFGPIAQDGTARCHICGGTTAAHQRLELVSGQLIPCPWVDDDDQPDVWLSREQYAAHVWTNVVTQAQREQYLADGCLSELDPALVDDLLLVLQTPRAGRPYGQSFPVVTFGPTSGPGVTVDVEL